MSRSIAFCCKRLLLVQKLCNATVQYLITDRISYKLVSTVEHLTAEETDIRGWWRTKTVLKEIE